MNNQFNLFSDKPKTNIKIFADILEERKRQREKWGIQTHLLSSWLMILGEEFGEACKAGNECYFRDSDLSNLRKELIQTTAVAIAIIESIDGE
jgi:hypothetical protein